MTQYCGQLPGITVYILWHSWSDFTLLKFQKKTKNNPVEHTRVHNRRVCNIQIRFLSLGHGGPEQKSAEMSQGRTSVGRIRNTMTRRTINHPLFKCRGQIKWRSLSQHTPLESASFTFCWDQNRVITSTDRGRCGTATEISSFNLSSLFQSSPSPDILRFFENAETEQI